MTAGRPAWHGSTAWETTVETLDYGSQRRRTPVRGVATRSIGILLLVVLAPIALLGLWLAVDAHRNDDDLAYFANLASDSAIAGKTPAQVIAIFGKPDDDSSRIPGERELTYRHGVADLQVLFQNDAAVRTKRWVK